ncbi:unnamed protein product [Pieris macdunnoughi]|uniref:Uncharacterized protein n=1 Tax=Pieris macdunnoughi TaxID=345717 RepID=A0A821REX6_9NEOP|nr:unnamed protein product [Pieris macdunnoughi]
MRKSIDSKFELFGVHSKTVHNATARSPTPNEKLTVDRSKQKKVNRERPVNLNLISESPPIRVERVLYITVSLTSLRKRQGQRTAVLTRERRFNESVFNGASCLFIIKSGAVFAVPAPLAPRPSLASPSPLL